MIKDILEFFVKEKFYTLMSGILIALYAFFLLSPHYKNPPLKKSAAVEHFHQAEAKLESKIKKAGSFENYLKDRPLLSGTFDILSIFLVIAFGAGLFIDFFFLFRPAWRKTLFLGPPPQTTPWKFSMLFKVIVLFITVSLLLSLVLNGVEGLFHSKSSNNFVLLLHTTLVDIVCFLLILWITRKENGNWKDLGLQVPSGKPFQEVLMGWGAYAAILPVFALILVALIYVANLFHYEPPPHPLVSVFLEEEKRSPALIFYSVFLAVVFGPIFEEIFFRGFCYPIFKKKFGRTAAMALSSSFFALIHDNTFAFWPIFILGMVLVYVYEKRGSLIPSMVLHITHNSIFIFYFFLAKNVVAREAG